MRRLGFATAAEIQVRMPYAVHLEPDAPTTRTAARAVRSAIEDLASWLGAKEVAYGELPPVWRAALTG